MHSTYQQSLASLRPSRMDSTPSNLVPIHTSNDEPPQAPESASTDWEISPCACGADTITRYHENRHRELEGRYLRLLRENTSLVRNGLKLRKDYDWLLDEVHYFVDDQLDNRIKFDGSTHQIRMELIKLGTLLGYPAPGSHPSDVPIDAGGVDIGFHQVYKKLLAIMDDWDEWDDAMRAAFNKRKSGAGDSADDPEVL